MLLARFFSQNAVAGVGREQGLNNGRLGGLIDFGHKVVDLFLRNPHRFNVQRGAVDDVASGASGLDGHVDHGVQVGGGHKLY